MKFKKLLFIALASIISIAVAVTATAYQTSNKSSVLIFPKGSNYVKEWKKVDSLAAKGTYTGIPGETFKADFGAYFKASLKRDIWENVTLTSNLSLFNNYTDKVQSNRANIDVDWNSSVVMKINKFLNATIFLHTIYDHDIDIDPKIDGTQRALQIKEAFGLGISFKF